LGQPACSGSSSNSARHGGRATIDRLLRLKFELHIRTIRLISKQVFAMSRFSIFVGSLCLAVVVLHRTAQAETEVIASESLTVQSNGPRTGEAGKEYFNVEGKDNAKYASFGVLVFDLPKEIQDKKPRKLELSLVQTTPRFAKDGAIKLFLAPDLDLKTGLKFDAEADDGIGKQIEPLLALGTGEFKMPEQGTPQTFTLTLNNQVRDRIAKGGKLCLVIVPADDSVAATYYGADQDDKERCPKLTFDFP
jgi:hypothetical protein